MRLTSDPDQAADIAQDAFVKLLPGGTEHPPQSNFRSWLYTVARNTAIDRIRSRKRQVSIPDMEDGDLERLLNRTASQPADGPEDAVMNQEIAALVWEAAKGLDPDDYSLLDLNLRQQLEPQEVAQVLGIKPGNAYTKLSRLKDRMEQAVNVLLMVRHGRNDCRDLDHVITRSAKTEELDPRVRRAVSRHIASCETCTTNRRRYVSAAVMFGALVPVVPAVAVKSQILSNLLGAFPIASGAGGGIASIALQSQGSAAAGGQVASMGATVFSRTADTLSGIAIGKGILAATAAGIIAFASLMAVGTLDVPGPLRALASALGIIDGADDYYRAGLSHKHQREWNAANISFAKSVEADPLRFDALAERGFVHRVLNQPTQAIRDFQDTIRIAESPSSFSDYYYVGFAHLHLAELGDGADHLQEALTAFSKAIAIKPKDADAFVNRGIVRRHLAQLDSDFPGLESAVTDFDSATRIDPNYADAYANRGIAFMYLGKLEESQGDFAQAVRIGGDPSNPYLYDQSYWLQLIDATVERIRGGGGG